MDKTTFSPGAGPLRIAVEDCIMMRGCPATAGSGILEGFTAPFDATVVEKLKGAGVSLTGTRQANEFGIPALSPSDTDRPSEAVAGVARGEWDAALCNDYSGILRRQATEEGACYIHPTYGTVSRFGLIPSVASMDQIGVACRCPRQGFALLSMIAGADPKDGALYPQSSYAYAPQAQPVRLGLAAEALTEADAAEKNAVLQFAELFEPRECHIPYFDLLPQMAYIIGCAELSNSISRYDGLKFGYRPASFRGIQDLYLRARTEGFGPRAKLSTIMGAMALSQAHYEGWYHKSMQLRRLLRQALDALFQEVDVLALPARMGKGCDPYRQSALYALATLTGSPAISFPFAGGGIQLLARPKNENALFTTWERRAKG